MKCRTKGLFVHKSHQGVASSNLVRPVSRTNMKKRKAIVKDHVLIPKHAKISEKEKEQLLERYNITLKELPKILKDDPAIAHLDVKNGDVIKIIRRSPTAGEAVFYRGVVGV